MEQLRPVSNFIGRIYSKLSTKAIGVVLRAHEATGSKSHPLIQASKRVLIDTQAHSSTIVVDNSDRLNLLKSIGLTESHIASIVLAHLFLDYALPPFLIALAYPVIHALTGLPAAADATISFFAARAAYGVVTGTAREVTYTIIQNRQPSQ